MALVLGELTAILGLDAKSFDKGLAGAQNNLKRFGVAGAAIAVAGAAAIAGALGKGIADNLNIDAGNKKLKAQLNLTADESAKAGKAAGALFAANYGESMEQIQAATGSVMSSIGGMRNASQAELEKVTGYALNLSEAFDVDVSEASASAGILMKNGLAKDATQAFDLITDAMNGVPETMRGEIFPIMDEYGTHFKTLGIDGTTAMGIVKAASQDGAIGMDKMGDSLKEFTLLSLAGDKTQAAAFESMGLNTATMSKAMAQGGEEGSKAFAQVVAGLQEIKDPAEQAQTAIDLFGTPLEDLGTSNIPQFLGQIDPLGDAFDSTAGAADNLGKNLAEGPAAGFDAFKRQAQASLIDVVNAGIMPAVAGLASYLSTTVGPAITDIGTWITGSALPALGAFGNWFSENQQTIGTWAGVITLLMLPVFIRLAIQAGLTAAAHVTAFALMSGAAIKHAAVWVAQSYLMVGRAAMVVGAWVLMGAQAMAQAVRMAAAWFIALGPIGWIIAAIIALVALVILNWDKVSTFTAQAWANIVSFITGAWENIKTGVSDGINSVIEWFTGMPDRILGALGNLGNLLLDAGKQILDGFLNGLTEGFNAVKDFVGGIGTWIADHKGPKRYDLGLLVPAGGWIMDGLNTGLKDSMPALGSQLSDVSWMIQNGIDPELAAGGNYAFSGSTARDAGSSANATSGGIHIENLTIERQDDPEQTWQVFKSRLSGSLRDAGLGVGELQG